MSSSCARQRGRDHMPARCCWQACRPCDGRIFSVFLQWAVIPFDRQRQPPPTRPLFAAVCVPEHFSVLHLFPSIQTSDLSFFSSLLVLITLLLHNPFSSHTLS